VRQRGLPLRRKLTVNLSPANLPKHGTGLDVAIAIAALATEADMDATSPRTTPISANSARRPPATRPGVPGGRGRGTRRIRRASSRTPTARKRSSSPE
jgi:magnesium chelatase family protein